MLELRGPCVGFKTRTFSRRDGSPGTEHMLHVATESGDPIVCLVRDEDLHALGMPGALALQSFGTAVALTVELADRWQNGAKVPCVRTVAPPLLLADVNGEVPAQAAG